MSKQLVLFAAGFAMGAFVFKAPKSEPVAPAPSAAHSTKPMSCSPLRPPRPTPMEAPAANPPAAENATLDARDFAEKILAIEHKPEVSRLWDVEAPSGQQTAQRENPLGGVIETEQTERGDVVSRSYNAGGVLTAVEWRRADGEFLIKTYFDDGSPKGVSVGRSDAARYTLIQSEQGQPSYREVTLDGGEKLVAKYDAIGNPTEEWHVGRDGRWLRVL